MRTTQGLRGAGYMRKGGPEATRLHNERARSAAAPAAPADPTPDAARTRASAGVSWPLIASAWALGAQMGGFTVWLYQVVL